MITVRCPECKRGTILRDGRCDECGLSYEAMLDAEAFLKSAIVVEPNDRGEPPKGGGSR